MAMSPSILPATPSFFFTFRRPPTSPLFPYTTLFRSLTGEVELSVSERVRMYRELLRARRLDERLLALDRKSTRLNSSHLVISYAVFCLKKKNIESFKHKSSLIRVLFTADLASERLHL